MQIEGQRERGNGAEVTVHKKPTTEDKSEEAKDKETHQRYSYVLLHTAKCLQQYA